MSEKKIAGISRGKISMPVLAVIYGPDGVGKTTFASEAPDAIFLGPEEGSSNVDTARFDNVKTFADVRMNINRLINEDLGFKTLVLDSLDHLELMLHTEICKTQGKDAIEDCFGSYGKWVSGVNGIWSSLMADLKLLREKRKMNILCLAHSHVKTFTDPNAAAGYDRYMLKMHNQSAAALWREFVEAVLFLNFETIVRKERVNDKKGKATSTQERILHTKRTHAFDAKNRYGLPDSIRFQMGYGWQLFEEARKAGNPDSFESVQEDIAELLEHEKLAPKKEAMKAAVEKAGQDINALVKIRSYARILTGES